MTVLAWSLSAVALVPVGLALWLTAQGGGAAGDILTVAALLAIPYSAVGVIIISRQPGNAVGWVFWAIGFFEALQLLAVAVAEAGLTAPPLATILAGAVGRLPSLILLVTLVPLLFPTGRPPAARWRWAGWLALGGLALLISVSVGTAPASPPPTDSQGMPWIALPIAAALLIGGVAVLAGAVGAVVSLAVRFRAARSVERDQLKWLLYGATLACLIVIGQFLLPVSGLAATFLWIGTLALPVTIGVAILRHRLFDIDLLISRTLLWGLLTTFVIAGYALVVLAVAPRIGAADDLVPSLLATGLVAILFQPVRSWLQRVVNRLVYGDRDDPYAAIARLGRRLEATAAPAAVLPAIVETVAQALKLPYVALTLRDGDRFALAAAHGRPVAGAAVLTVPLTYQSDPVGELVLAPRTPADPFSPDDRRLLADLARQIGVAAHAVQLTTDLQRSRERLVTAREEERRRLRNDLHDGLGPALSGLHLRAETARNLIRNNPEAEALLADVAAQTEAAVGDIRRLVYSLRPPALDDLGLVPALRELAVSSGPAVTIEATPVLPPLPAAVEVAAFRIAQEALTNVARHAQANSCSLSLRITARELQLEVVDDGVGLPDQPRVGVGLRSMRDRATELGGALTIEHASAGGTRIVVTLPLVGLEPSGAEPAAD